MSSVFFIFLSLFCIFSSIRLTCLYVIIYQNKNQVKN
uniref:Uncharacterized protein n=1 Tax=Siphoviridae sp. ctr2f5 TaxID=2825684 RepID=A0A8S5QE95_9CAUD|nr:MAG TPA: hypothetical protein [Siphoviridae sp. ctr2f5]